jgi:hypothetical protein
MQDTDVLWRGTASARWPLYTGAAFIVLAVILSVATRQYAFMAMIIAAPFIMALAAISVEVSSKGVLVRYSGALGWPTTRIPLASIQDARVINYNPGPAGGWGYRGSLKVFGQAALAIRKGPGLRLGLGGKRWFMVTVDDAAGAVQALQQLGTTVS